MENAKDTFYITMRNRLAAMNPQRVMILRGVQRPSILMEEAEAVVPQIPSDAFVLRWADLSVDTQLSSMLVQMTCEFHYSTGGTVTNTGLDRGRALAEMDAELLAMLSPNSTQKMNYAQTPAAAMETMVFWSEPVFLATTTLRERITRVAKVTVYAFQEPGEL
jgi:hypothetical protein